tara:strand:+ start:996 stop:1223 length:228 start_codon:yes stop_codon:yes gene_type:complete
MFKVWLLVALLHTPSMPSVKYQAHIYGTEQECYESLAEFLNIYEKKSDEYKQYTKVDGHCLEFESFPIARLMSNV